MAQTTLPQRCSLGFVSRNFKTGLGVYTVRGRPHTMSGYSAYTITARHLYWPPAQHQTGAANGSGVCGVEPNGGQNLDLVV